MGLLLELNLFSLCFICVMQAVNPSGFCAITQLWIYVTHLAPHEGGGESRSPVFEGAESQVRGAGMGSPARGSQQRPRCGRGQGRQEEGGQVLPA